MDKVKAYLRNLGLSEIEIKCYLKLLALGPMTVAQLSHAIKINRTASYGYVNTLLEQGLIAKVKGPGSKISATSPEQLHILVEQKVIHASALQEGLPNIIYSLNSLTKQAHSSESEIKYYKGRRGAQAIYHEVLRSKEIRSYFNPAQADIIFPENFDLFYNAFEKNHQMIIREICEDSHEARQQIERNQTHKKHVWKLFPKHIKLITTDILIYDGKVAIINVGDKEHITGVVLSNKDYYNSSVQLFDLLWSLLPEIKR